MSLSIQEASQALLGASVFRNRYADRHGSIPPIDKILMSATGNGDSYRVIQESILKNGKTESRLLNTLQNQQQNNQFIEAASSIQHAASLARLTAQDLAGSKLAQEKVQDAIKESFHKIEASNSGKEVGDSLESTLRNEIFFAIGNEQLSDMLMKIAETLYVQDVQASVFAAYDVDDPENNDSGLNI
ncbi:hypothetical protein SJI19_16580 [Acerihabitans sp. TG2]|uniref:hypothetical protein n=1 Tax=Acerihabitans sp. TG2 TaxID=3096008 RepID=UPI002B223CAF|nr:hypothetical protein [Acerihabitans sp. TG2]MEA9392141.1 hypothetical protein [Acerihabitans sp. TG2]